MDEPNRPRVAVPQAQAAPVRGGVTPVVQPRIPGARAFKRVWPDRIVGVLGVLVILATTFTFFNWHVPVVVEPAYAVQWVETPTNATFSGLVGLEAPPSPTDPGPPPTTYDHRFRIDAYNVTQVVIAVDVKDEIGTTVSHGDEMEVVVTSGDDPAITQTQTGIAPPDEVRRFLFTFEFAALPNVTRAPVASLGEAQAYVADQQTGLGRGEWLVSIRLVRANGTEPVPPYDSRLPCEPANERAGLCRIDRGNAFDVTSIVYTYAPTFRKLS